MRWDGWDIDDGTDPDGLCANREDHWPHPHVSKTLGEFWCCANQAEREPYRSEQARARLALGDG